MHIAITSRHFKLTQPIKSYFHNLIQSLSKYNLEILSPKVIISYEEKKGKKQKIYHVQLSLKLAKTNPLIINQKDKDLYSAADLAIGRMHRLLARHHEKINHKHATPQEELLSISMLKDEWLTTKESDEIVPMDLLLHKPLEIHDALEQLKSSTQQFFVFNDKDSKLRILYKRSDGKYGLY